LFKEESSSIEGPAVVAFSNETGRTLPTSASTYADQPNSNCLAALQPQNFLAAPTDYVECLGVYHPPQQTDQEVLSSTKSRKDVSSKVVDSCSSDSDEADSGDDLSSSGKDSDNESHKQVKKKKRKSNDVLNKIVEKYVKVVERKLDKSKARNKQLKKDQFNFNKQMSGKDEALGRYKSLVDAIVEKVMANPELSTVLEIPLVPGAIAILEQSKFRVLKKQQASS
jgi:hypothetical protein